MSSLFFRSLFVLSLVTTLSTPLFAQESVEEVDASPVVFTNDTLSVLEGNTAFVRLTADDIQETTRVRVRITPDTARSGTDYRNPGVVTVTFYKNGVKSKRIGVRTINRSGTQGERSFTASIISVNGKAVPQDLETLDVTVVDRGTTTPARTTTGTTPPPVATKPATDVVTQAPTSTAPAVPASPRCVGGQSVRHGSGSVYGRFNPGKLSYIVKQNYHIPFTVPVLWSQKTTYSQHLFIKWGALGPLYGTDFTVGSGVIDSDISISECPGDFNPQTACVGKGAGSYGMAILAPTSNRDLIPIQTYFGQVNCEVQGGKTYYFNIRVNECMGARICSNETLETGPTDFYDPGYWNDKSRCDAMVRTSVRDASGNIVENDGTTWCRAWGHIQ